MKKIIVFIILISCQNKEKTYFKSYSVDGVTYSCEDYFKLNKVVKEICYYPTLDTLSIINFNNNKKDGEFKEFYKNNQIKTKGQFLLNNKIGIWKEYYEDSKLKSILLYKESIDSSDLFYKKEYYENGSLKTCILPIELSTNSENLEYKIGYTYQLYIKLKFSIYENYRLNGELLTVEPKQDANIFLSKDPHILICEFTPYKTGDNFIKGQIYEFEGNSEKDEYSGITMFDFKYNASK